MPTDNRETVLANERSFTWCAVSDWTPPVAVRSIAEDGRERMRVPMLEMTISDYVHVSGERVQETGMRLTAPSVNTQNTAISQKSLCRRRLSTLVSLGRETGFRRSGSKDVVSSVGSSSEPWGGDSTAGVSGSTRRVIAPRRYVSPRNTDRKAVKWVTFNDPETGSVNQVDAMTERKSGERPKRAMLPPDAMPLWLGKNLDAANRDEKYLKAQLS
jgi:hypothetical protein